MAAAENSTESSTPRVVGRPFEKGRSGNPGGRPKGLAKAVRDRLDEAALKATGEQGAGASVLVGFWARVLADEKEDTGLRMKAAQMLAERGWGKAPAYAPVEDDDPLELSEHEATEVAAQFDAKLDELAERRNVA